jgi:hypothetical protein
MENKTTPHVAVVDVVLVGVVMLDLNSSNALRLL